MSDKKRGKRTRDSQTGDLVKEPSKRRLRQQLSHYQPQPKTNPVRDDDYQYLVSNIMS